jgi:hypothetical protein
MMGLVELNDLDDLAAIVEKHGRTVHDAATPPDVQRFQSVAMPCDEPIRPTAPGS